MNTDVKYFACRPPYQYRLSEWVVSALAPPPTFSYCRKASQNAIQLVQLQVTQAKVSLLDFLFFWSKCGNYYNNYGSWEVYTFKSKWLYYNPLYIITLAHVQRVNKTPSQNKTSLQSETALWINFCCKIRIGAGKGSPLSMVTYKQIIFNLIMVG